MTESAPDLPRRDIKPKIKNLTANYKDAPNIVWQHRIGTSAKRGPDYGWEDFHPDDSVKLNAAWASSQTAKVNIQDKWTVDLGKMLQTTNGSLGKRREVRRIVRPKMSSAHAPVRPKTSSAHDSVVSNVKISRYCIGYR